MLPTPDTSHIDTSRIYEPAEDSFLLLDTLSSDAETEYLRARFVAYPCTPLVVEVGTGSGVVLAFLTANARYILNRSDVIAVGIDVNEHACRAAAETVRRAWTMPPRSEGHTPLLDLMQADLLTSLRPGSVDLLVFNPPYVPTTSLPEISAPTVGEDAYAAESRLLELSYAGGTDGMEVTRRFLNQLPETLSKHGVAYLLLCAQNKPADVLKEIEGDALLEGCIVSKSGKTGGWEKLCIVRITRR